LVRSKQRLCPTLVSMDLLTSLQLKTSVKLSEISKLTSADCLGKLAICYSDTIKTIEVGGKVIFCGNGGSAAESQHFAAELVSKFMRVRGSISSMSLTTDTSAITSIANDFGYEFIFSRQLEAVCTDKDVLIAMSTSGKSLNIVNALHKAHEMNVRSWLWTGSNAGAEEFSKSLPDTTSLLIFPSDSTDVIQEQMLIAGHLLCGMIEDTYCK